MKHRWNPEGYPCRKCAFVARTGGELGGHRNWCRGREDVAGASTREGEDGGISAVATPAAPPRFGRSES